MANREDQSSHKPATQIVTGGRRKEWTEAVVNPPVWRASTHLYDSVADLRAGIGNNEDGRFFYGRRGSPTQWSLAEALTEMEPGAVGTMLYPSGVAAIACAMLAILKPGDEILLTDSSYDPSRNYADAFLKPMGITARYYDPLIGADIGALLTDKTKAILLESPGSLTFEVQDIPAICAMAKEARIVTFLDNTWATSRFFPALEHGVDISIVAATKYIVGHSDVMMGAATTHERYWTRLRRTAQQLGQVVSPDDAYLAARGLRTLEVRLKQHEQSALTVAHWLKDRPEVGQVLHPALAGCPGHDIWKRDFKGSSGLFSFELSQGDEKSRAAFIDALTLFGIGYSWGGFESLALPVDPGKYRTATDWMMTGALVRLHIGLEDPDDLIADLAKAFEHYNSVL
ncbi:cystathionine beta-lyase [Parasphingorhabdus cellanae]|uniref:Cystathionine beta-lyase n=1 Tax=Parasphingorhabdus cellanae TaxID=2806553 RepID=A0ABX7T1C3_9SPHN|nr:cystathionine beta-lyase [Parasphingorhabdus cellanae]QTD55354.1 cystathionine beta-lyase [Parasphingorhabdus cellanae]